MTHTRTRTYIRETFADPYKTCDECDEWITGFLRTDSGPYLNYPCRHNASYTDRCPSWGPVDGCSCAEHLGHVPHGQPEDA